MVSLTGRSFLSFTNNKKTYATVVVGILLGVIQGLDATGVIHFHIPMYVDVILGFLGLGALRSGVQTSTAGVTEAVVNLIEALESATTVAQTKTAVEAVNQVVQTPGYKTATETEQTDMLNEGQLTKGH